MKKLVSILVSPTAFKGTLSPWAAAHLLSKQFTKKTRYKVVKAPLADGGDGTYEVLAKAFHVKPIRTTVQGPLGKPVRARWGFNKNKKIALIEMAQASGLALVAGRNRILSATTFGTGQLIKAALNKGAREIVIGVGGTATGEGGAGALQALGLRLYDRHHHLLSAHPVDLTRLHHVDFRNLDPRLKKTKISVLCDVTNPLLGPRGSARTFGPQKGATPAQVRLLERALKNWSRFAKNKNHHKPGCGAAGALAFGLYGFLGARLVPGCPFIMKAVKWDQALKKAQIIVTGEGQVDPTSFSGKVLGEIIRKKGRRPVSVICGRWRVRSK